MFDHVTATMLDDGQLRRPSLGVQLRPTVTKALRVSEWVLSDSLTPRPASVGAEPPVMLQLQFGSSIVPPETWSIPGNWYSPTEEPGARPPLISKLAL